MRKIWNVTMQILINLRLCHLYAKLGNLPVAKIRSSKKGFFTKLPTLKSPLNKRYYSFCRIISKLFPDDQYIMANRI